MNVFELLGIIAINNKGANKSIDETGNKAQTLQAKMGRAFTKIGKDAVACGKAVAKGLAVISAAGAAVTGALLKSSVSAYAEFEQLEGGVKKLFGEDVAKTVMENANKAFKTAGLSANEYMQQATSFSASLISGLAGDTAAAAELTDIAIQDMADNVNTFGTEMGLVQNAYQGFAKQNYTMLDNLKLGYGGTQAEMARLINDSGVLGKDFKVTAETVNKVSFAKIIEAIHVVQSNMEIAGTTSKEASDTISGSFSMWKASWTNLMTGLGDDENIDPLVDAFFEAGNTALKNLAKVLPKIGGNIKAAMSRAGTYIKQAWEQNIWPTVQNFVIRFGIELPDWSVIDGSLSSWWEGTGKPAVENIKSFFIDIGTWISENKEMVKSFLIATAGALLIMNAPLALLIGALLIVAANWEKIKTVVTNALEAVNNFFSVTIPEAWKDMVEDIKKWWSDNVETPINNAIAAVEKFLGMNSDKTITVTYKQQIQTTAETIGDGVTESTGSSFWGALAKINAITFTQNPDAPFINWNADGAVFDKPTIFNTRLGLQGVGEAGKEAVAPINVLQDYVSAAVRSEMGRMESGFSNILNVLQTIAQNTAGGPNVVLDTGVLVGQMAPRLDAQLGTLTARKERRG